MGQFNQLPDKARRCGRTDATEAIEAKTIYRLEEHRDSTLHDTSM